MSVLQEETVMLAQAEERLPEIDDAQDIDNGLFNKYMLPKVALTVISMAALIGSWLTAPGQSGGTFIWTVGVLAKWLFFASLGFFIGASAWREFMTKPATRLLAAKEAEAYERRQFARHEAWSKVASIVLVPAGLTLMSLRASSMEVFPFLRPYVWAAIVITVSLGALNLMLGKRTTERLLMAMGLLLLLIEAVLSVRLTAPFHGLAVAVRFVHLLAFSLWFGGAIWNIFIAVPAARGHISFPVVAAAHLQLERFRATVRVVFPLIILTGLYQAYAILGLSVSALIGTTFGHAVMAKLGLIVVLFGIFLTCPMWQACSPITGMCKLDEFEGM